MIVVRSVPCAADSSIGNAALKINALDLTVMCVDH